MEQIYSSLQKNAQEYNVQFTKYTHRVGNQLMFDESEMFFAPIPLMPDIALVSSFYFTAIQLADLKICFDNWEIRGHLSCNMIY